MEDNVAKLNKSFKTLLNDKKLKHFLEFALAVGNYLNGTSARGGAYAFKLGMKKKLLLV